MEIAAKEETESLRISHLYAPLKENHGALELGDFSICVCTDEEGAKLQGQLKDMRRIQTEN